MVGKKKTKISILTEQPLLDTVENSNLPFQVLVLEKTQILLILVSNDLAAGEATNRDNHIRKEERYI